MDTAQALALVQEANDASAFAEALKQYLLLRLRLPSDVCEDRITRLVVFSVKMQMPGVTFVEEKLAGSDCHQTSYVTKKKCLLMMETERNLGAVLSDEALNRVETVSDYAEALWHAKGEMMDGCKHASK